mmetsp:Transcript_32005/g.77958  ORF Transcript_32005/g.77958 Transcript_32005/m.77958 type:complete len:318 (-) Transcript_32005:5-958(-)
MKQDGFAVKVHRKRVQFDGYNCGWATVMLTTAMLQQCRCLHDPVVLPRGVTHGNQEAKKQVMFDFRECLRRLCIWELLNGKLTWSAADLDMRENAAEIAENTRIAMCDYAKKSKKLLKGKKDVVSLLSDDDDDWDVSSHPHKDKNGVAFKLPAGDSETATENDDYYFTFDPINKQFELLDPAMTPRGKRASRRASGLPSPKSRKLLRKSRRLGRQQASRSNKNAAGAPPESKSSRKRRATVEKSDSGESADSSVIVNRARTMKGKRVLKPPHPSGKRRKVSPNPLQKILKIRAYKSSRLITTTSISETEADANQQYQ